MGLVTHPYQIQTHKINIYMIGSFCIKQVNTT